MLMITIRGGDPERKLKWTFDMYDADKSGALTPDEVEKMFTQLLAAETKVRAEPRIRLPLAAAVECLRVRPQEAKRKQMILDLVKVFDKDRDGKITFDELKKGMQKDEFLCNYVAKGKQLSDVVDSAFQGKSMICAVM